MSYKTDFKGDTMAVEVWLLDLEEFEEKAELVPKTRAEQLMICCLQGPDGLAYDRMPNKQQQSELKKLGFPTDLLRDVKFCIATESSAGFFDKNEKLKQAVDKFIEWSKCKRKLENMGAKGIAISWETTTVDGVKRSVKTETVNGITATTVFEEKEDSADQLHGNISGNKNYIGFMQNNSGINTGGGAFNAIASQTITKRPSWW
ncbi:MAG: hypothetical protein K2Q45_07075 [Nitrosomonas sp.]|nr:hypothetical protein [Nitrosomonas sp.]